MLISTARFSRILRSRSIWFQYRRHAHTPAIFKWNDPLDSSVLFTEDEKAIQETAREYCQERLLPRVLGGSPLD